jgi:hypothetical protein
MGYVTKILDIVEDNRIKLDQCDPGTVIELKTLNTIYRLVVIRGTECLVEGGRWFTPAAQSTVIGSVHGGVSAELIHRVDHGYITIGMRLEIVHSDPKTDSITLSRIEKITLTGPEGAWQYSLPKEELSDTIPNPRCR